MAGGAGQTDEEATDQLGLFAEEPKPLAAFTLRDWDWQDCDNARRAWNSATREERLAWCERWKIETTYLDEEAPHA